MPARRAKDRTAITPEEVFGRVVQGFRKAQGLSQEELGFESGHHRTYVSLIERGGRSASLRTILALAAALRVPPSELLREVEARLARARVRPLKPGQDQP